MCTQFNSYAEAKQYIEQFLCNLSYEELNTFITFIQKFNLRPENKSNNESLLAILDREV